MEERQCLKSSNHSADSNQRRYSDPWVGTVDAHGKIDFSRRVGGYTGGYHTGDEGDLYVDSPEEGKIYAYGQKDYRGNTGFVAYAIYRNEEFMQVEKKDLIKAINGEPFGEGVEQ